MLTCPKCNREQHVVCGNKTCVCYKRIPHGERPQVYRPMLRFWIVPKWLFNFLWDFVRKPHTFGLYELIECPYCGYSQSFDYWAEREMEQTFASQAISMTVEA